MQYPTHIVACSAIAFTIFYYLLRSRRKLHSAHCSTLEAVQESVTALSSVEYSAELSVLSDQTYTVFYQEAMPTFAKVSHEAYSHKSETTVPINCISKECKLTSSNLVATPAKMDTPVNLDLGSSVESGSDHARTPDSSSPLASPGLPSRINDLPPGCFNDPSNDIYEDDPEELNGTMIPKVLIPSELWAEAVDQDIWHETFCVPAHMGGVLIGRLGKNVRELKNIWGAEFCLNTCPGRQDTLVFKLSCPVKHKDEVLRWVARRFRMRPSRTPIGNPNQLKRYLPLGEPIPVQVRSLYAAKEFFLTIEDDEYARYLKMQAELDKDYSSLNNFRMQLCEPVTSGTVAVVPHSQGFARALIISVFPTWPKTVSYFLLDHGTFGIVVLNKLRKIRAKYMRTPFQAIHVSWAHAFPVFSDVPDIHILRTFFASGRVHAFAVRMETCCRASVAFGQICPPPYSNSGLIDVLVNACNSGLYMTVPLAIYPNRQSWLNGTNVPYYPFNYSAIDYSHLVGYIAEDPSCMSQDNQSLAVDCNTNQNEVSSETATTSWNQRNGQIQQKENQRARETVNFKTATKNGPTEAEPKRKPLSVRNARGSACTGYKGAMPRGRTNNSHLIRSRD